MRTPRALTLSLCAVLITITAGGTAYAQVPRADLPPVVVPEIANDLAVADNGTALLSFFDLRQVGVVRSDGGLTTIDVGCSPTSVAIAPTGGQGWAVCVNDPHIYAIDLSTRQITVASLDLLNPVQLAYTAARDQLVVGGMTGQITVIGVDQGNYLKRSSFSVGGDLSALTLSRDGTVGYAASYVSQVSRLDLVAGSAKTLSLQGGSYSITSLSLSPSEAILYAAGAKGGPSSIPDSVVLALDPANGKTLQEKAFVVTPSGFSSIYLGACNRTLYVGSGLGVDIGSTSTGVFGIDLDATGRMGDFVPVINQQASTSTLNASPSCTRGAAVSTNLELLRWTAEDPPYPASITITGALAKGQLTLTGSSSGLASSTKVSVYVKVAGKKGATFVKQKKTAAIGAGGSFTWKGAVTGTRVSVYVQAGEATSPTITVRSR